MEADATECMHGLDPMWCTPCKRALGYMPGKLEQYNDCSVRAVAAVTGATYAEAVDLLAAQGRRGGQGAMVDQMVDAIEAAGWTVTPSPLDLTQAVSRSRHGRTFVVAAYRGRKSAGHAYAIVAGKTVNAGRWTQGVRYRVWEVA